MAERINHKLMRCECRSFCQRQLSVARAAPELRQLRQFSSVLASLPRFSQGSLALSLSFSFCFFGGEFRLFALLVQTKQISLTLGCLACKCHFSVQITQFITFHLTRRVESRVKQSKSPNESLPHSLPLSFLPSPSFPAHTLRMCFQFQLPGQIGSQSF